MMLLSGHGWVSDMAELLLFKSGVVGLVMVLSLQISDSLVRSWLGY